MTLVTSPEKLMQPPFARRISSVLRALDVLADPWAFLVLRECFFGMRRFDAFQTQLQIARNVLTERLDHLVSEGVLVRVRYQARPPRDEYRLTQPGRDFYQSIVALMQWGDRWRPQRNGPPLRLFSKATGAELQPVVICAHCGQPVSPFEVEFHDGPGVGPERSVLPGSTRRSSMVDTYTRGRPCSVASALAVIGDRWSFRVLRDAFFGVKRFEKLQVATGASRKILAGRLHDLTAAGILEKHPYQDRPIRHEYLLSPAGLDLYPTFLLLMAWGDRWRAPNAGPPLILIHKQCGAVVKPILVDRIDQKPITPENVKYRSNYGLDDHTLERVSTTYG